MMIKTDFPPKLIVKNKETGFIGVTCQDILGPFSCNLPDEISVVYDGTAIALGTDYRLLEILSPENAVADINKCGGGKNEEACIFLVIGHDGAKCQRFGDLRWNLILRTMRAKRHPEKLLPKCQLS